MIRRTTFCQLIFFLFQFCIYTPKRSNCDLSAINILEYDLPHNYFSKLMMSLVVLLLCVILSLLGLIDCMGYFYLMFGIDLLSAVAFILLLFGRWNFSSSMETVFYYSGTKIGGRISSLQLQTNLDSFPYYQIIFGQF